MNTFTSESRVGEIAVEQPSATRAFYKFGIDFCCGGGKSLGSVCEKKGLDVQTVLAEINGQMNQTEESVNKWTGALPTVLIAHIISNFHEPLRQELPRLQAMLDKVQKVHGHVDPERFEQMQATFKPLVSELTEHMSNEEAILFPMVMQGQLTEAVTLLDTYETEHEAAGNALARLRTLTDDYTPPDYACNTWRALWSGLHDLEITMHQHVHLENNILFENAKKQVNN